MVMWLSQLRPSLQFDARRFVTFQELPKVSISEVPSRPRSLASPAPVGFVYFNKNGIVPAQGWTGWARRRRTLRGSNRTASTPVESCVPSGFVAGSLSSSCSVNALAAGTEVGSRGPRKLKEIVKRAPSTVRLSESSAGLPVPALSCVVPSIFAAGLPARSRMPPVAGGVYLSQEVVSFANTRKVTALFTTTTVSTDLSEP